MWNTQRRSRDADRLLLYGIHTWITSPLLFLFWVCLHTRTHKNVISLKSLKRREEEEEEETKRTIAVSLLVSTIILFHYLLPWPALWIVFSFSSISFSLCCCCCRFWFFFVFSISSLGHHSTEASNSRFVCRCLKPVVYTVHLLYYFSLSLSLTLIWKTNKQNKNKTQSMSIVVKYIPPPLLADTCHHYRSFKNAAWCFWYNRIYIHVYRIDREFFAFIDTPSSDRWWYIYPATSSNLFGFMLYSYLHVSIAVRNYLCWALTRGFHNAARRMYTMAGSWWSCYRYAGRSTVYNGVTGFPPIRDCTTDLACLIGSPPPTRLYVTSAPSSPSKRIRGTASSAPKPISWNISVYSGIYILNFFLI